MKRILPIIKNYSKTTNLTGLGICLLIIEVIVLAISFAFDIESNIPLYTAAMLAIIGILFIIGQTKRESKY